jgi:hypothetical protein
MADIQGTEGVPALFNDPLALENFLSRSIAQIRSGSPDELLSSILGVRYLLQENNVAFYTLNRLVERDFFSWILPLIESSAIPRAVREHICAVFNNLVFVPNGPQCLAANNVPGRLLAAVAACDDVDICEESSLLASVYLFVGNQAGQSQATARSVNLAQTLSVLDRAVTLSLDGRASTPLFKGVCSLCSNLFVHKSEPQPASAVRATLPVVARAFLTLDPRSHPDALVSLASWFACAFNDRLPAADWDLLAASGVLPRLFGLALATLGATSTDPNTNAAGPDAGAVAAAGAGAAARTDAVTEAGEGAAQSAGADAGAGADGDTSGGAVESPLSEALRSFRGCRLRVNDALPTLMLLGEAAAHADGSVTTRVFTGETFQFLAALAAAPQPMPLGTAKEFFWTLSNVASDSQPLRAEIVRRGVLRGRLRELAAELRGARSDDDVWRVGTEAVWLLFRLLSEPADDPAAVAAYLVAAGAVALLAAALGTGRVHMAQRGPTTAHYGSHCLRMLIQSGPTGRDAGYADRGEPIANECLREFCAANGAYALLHALQYSGAGPRAVVELFRETIGPIIGADTIFADETRTELRKEFTRLLGLDA